MSASAAAPARAAFPLRYARPAAFALGIGVWTAALAFAPAAAAVVLAFYLAATLALVAARHLGVSQAGVPLEPSRPDASPPACAPFVSVQIAIHDEPPALVAQTLRCLADLDYDRYEVIVLDNNTPDPATWRPVERVCAGLGERFRFVHRDGVRGFKAGALDLCAQLQHPDAELVLVLDADYCVDRDVLARAVGHFADPRVALVQFPQAYRNGDGPLAALADEYGHFFRVYMRMANRLDCVLATGTVCVVRSSALKAIGGWMGTSITEDAELGLRLHEAGYRGVYLPHVTGRGLMPTTLDALRKQRRRWTFGNAQVLRRALASRRLSPGRTAGVLLQLTAWFSPLAFPLATLGLCGALALMGADTRLSAVLALASAWTFLAGQALLFARALSGPMTGRMRAFALHMGLAWEGATAWLDCFSGTRLGFVRTDKTGRAGPAWAPLPGLAMAGLALASGLALLPAAPAAGIACALLALPLSGVLLLGRTLRAAG